MLFAGMNNIRWIDTHRPMHSVACHWRNGVFAGVCLVCAGVCLVCARTHTLVFDGLMEREGPALRIGLRFILVDLCRMLPCALLLLPCLRLRSSFGTQTISSSTMLTTRVFGGGRDSVLF